MTLVVLDTNVISEIFRPSPEASVVDWLASLTGEVAITSVAAEHYAQVVAHRRDAGRPIGGMDALIAAITRQNGAALATRDIAGFAELGIDLIDPWAYRA